MRFYPLVVDDNGDHGQVELPIGDWIVCVELGPAPWNTAVIGPRTAWVATTEP